MPNEPLDVGKLDALLDEEEARKARQTQLVAPAVDPDGMGRALRIGREKALPPIVVAENIGEFDEGDRLDKVQGLARDNPAVGSWLKDPSSRRPVPRRPRQHRRAVEAGRHPVRGADGGQAADDAGPDAGVA